ncbi:hypothetical protein [Terriglobus saanensis]|uniref:hypothetical protein n=1 Tax=Terriglobus saanensis TaxID=870903 RepID=UPI0003252CEB|nr:hypothetical protein [Terriglobus saanensis]
MKKTRKEVLASPAPDGTDKVAAAIQAGFFQAKFQDSSAWRADTIARTVSMSR